MPDSVGSPPQAAPSQGNVGSLFREYVANPIIRGLGGQVKPPAAPQPEDGEKPRPRPRPEPQPDEEGEPKPAHGQDDVIGLNDFLTNEARQRVDKKVAAGPPENQGASEKPENSDGKDGKKDTNGEDDNVSSTPKQSWLSNMANSVANALQQPSGEPVIQQQQFQNPQAFQPQFLQQGAMGIPGTSGMGIPGMANMGPPGMAGDIWQQHLQIPQTNFLTAPNPYRNAGMMMGGGGMPMMGGGGMGMMNGSVNPLVLQDYFSAIFGSFGANGNMWGAGNMAGVSGYRDNDNRFIPDMGGIGGIGGFCGFGGGLNAMAGINILGGGIGMMMMPSMFF